MIGVLEVGIWDVLCHLWVKYQLEIGFVFDALSKPRCLLTWLDSKEYLKFLSMVIHIWLWIWEIAIK